MTITFFALLLLIVPQLSALPVDDRVSSPPGMLNATIYSGYLSTTVADRKIHYIFIQASVDEPLKAPLTVWLNGGPGCSSLIGMMQQIGPYIVGDTYKLGDQLKKNQYGWDKVSNLLFLESPAIVGFSSDTDQSFVYTDEQTAKDAFAALKDFMQMKAPEFAKSTLFITGESYAGKYIPDITKLILGNNRDKALPYLNLTGIMVGNGVMTFEEDSLTKSSIEYMLDHQFVSTRLESVYRHSCQRDFHSPRCRFFRYEFDVLRAYINHYNIYETCQDYSTSAIRLLEALSSKHQKKDGILYQSGENYLGQIPTCPSDEGMVSYWNLNKFAYKVDKVNKNWTVCVKLKYNITDRGSMDEYREIVSNGGVKVWLFSGDWDDVVPFPDTEKNVDKMWRYNKNGGWTFWNVGEHHAGFYQLYGEKLTLITVKGASHMVPQTKPRPSFQLFSNFVNNKPINNQVF